MKGFIYGVKVTTISEYSKDKSKRIKKNKIDPRCFSCKQAECKGTCDCVDRRVVEK